MMIGSRVWIAGWLSLVFALTLIGAPSRAAEPERFAIASGPVGGAYYRLAGAVCEAFSGASTSRATQCLVLPTSGSSENLARLDENSAEFAILQSDWLYRAQAQSVTKLRAVVALEGRMVTVVAGPNSGILDIEDLKNRRLSFGPEGSAMTFGGDTLLAALDWQVDDFSEIVPMPLAAMPGALCDGRIDAFVLPLVHPDPIVAESLALCGGRLVNVTGPAIDAALGAWPFMSALNLPAALYDRQTDAVDSFGLKAILTTTEGADDALVASLTEAMVKRGKDRQALLQGIGASIHPAAMERLTALGLVTTPTQNE